MQALTLELRAKGRRGASAKDQGLAINERGRIPADVVTKYCGYRAVKLRFARAFVRTGTPRL